MPDADLLVDLDDQQRVAVQTVRGPVCVLAGAGSGKTRVVTRRIAYAVRVGAVASQQVMAVTFSVRAAAELSSRLAALEVHGVSSRTFHSAALRQLRYFWPRVVGGVRPDVVDDKRAVLGRAALDCGLRSDQDELGELAGEIEWAKVALVAAADYPQIAQAAGRSPSRPADEVAAIYDRYEWLKRDAGLIDFEDILLLTAAVLEEHPELAGQLRARFRYFVVDEYQDVNPLQQRLLASWLGERDDICVVGDTAQTIYSFNGANHRYLAGFPDRYPGATVVRLDRDYRSGPAVVSVANALLGPGKGELRAAGPGGPPVRLQGFADPTEEAIAVASRAGELVAGGANVAVLVRNRAQLAEYEAALLRAGLPVVGRPVPALGRRAVLLTTLHQAKGLEWDGVFLVGLVDGVLPTSRAVGPDQLAEERRLLYVGVTRARRWLWLSWHDADRGRGRRRSPFLDQLDRVAVAGPAG